MKPSEYIAVIDGGVTGRVPRIEQHNNKRLAEWLTLPPQE
jgi:hypothetical protein